MPSRRQVLAAGCLAPAGGSGCSQVRESLAAGGTGGETTSGGTDTDDASEFRITVTDGDREVELLTGADVATVGEVEPARTADAYRLPITLTDDGADSFADGLREAGALEDPDPHRLRTYFEGELLSEAKLGPGLAETIQSGEWEARFLFHVTDRETAQEVREALESA
ncbi:hypothetical protein [Halorussus caseinilyticus]|uniref:Lipoprotein n=1 Tax=Halorussus caseinilyticus TaxID=3034025 RepID=A0ABD5WQD7_9EURY